MKPHSPELLEELEAGRVDVRDAIELYFDSGVVRLVLGVKGLFGWDDVAGVLPPWRVGGPADEDLWSDAGWWRNDRVDGQPLGDDVFYGGGNLVGLDVPENALGPESRAITARVFETYLSEGSDIPANTFDDGVRATIDEEEWEGRPAVLSTFWLDHTGTPILREQVAVRTMDQMVLDTDAQGVPVRSLILEEPDIMQRDIEGKTANAAFQALIDPDDKAFEHVASAQRQKISFGRAPEGTVA
ncbi:hypothetical protein [Devosia sediminis]|uniref:Uncharacterized protein n=1 Tax=Devosia sediminis TaxID=2798801 RepID=A0A934MKC8_9HYPH|nr:hypothetical protein [Devosia sediminis]MBJ3783421.1 hypothetical protein [Devosia sediminis]